MKKKKKKVFHFNRISQAHTTKKETNPGMYESKRSKSYIIVFQAIVSKIKELQEWKKKVGEKVGGAYLRL